MRAKLFRIPRNRSAASAVAASVVFLLLGACAVMAESPAEPNAPQLGLGSQPVQESHGVYPPGHSGAGGFLPLDIGNHWTYSGEQSITGEHVSPYVIHTLEERTLIGTEELFGREYILEEQENFEDSSPGPTYWVRYRQDRSGLYEADVAISQPPGGMVNGRAEAARNEGTPDSYVTRFRRHILETSEAQYRDVYLRAYDQVLKRVETIKGVLRGGMPASSRPAPPPGGVLPDEITTLEYPLHPGQEWIIRDDPWFAAAVEGQEVLDLAPGKMNGFRLSIVNEAMSAGDVVHVWYGRDGFLGMFLYVTSEMRDENGNPLGTLVFEERLFLDSFALARGR